MTDIRQRIADVATGALKQQHGFIRADGTIYMGSTGSVDVAKLAEMITTELGLNPERGVRYKHASEIIALKEDQQYSDYGPTWESLIRLVTVWEPAT